MFRNDISNVQILGPADIPVELEMREFFTGITEDRKTAFLGPPNHETNTAWASIQDGNLPMIVNLILQILYKLESY